MTYEHTGMGDSPAQVQLDHDRRMEQLAFTTQPGWPGATQTGRPQRPAVPPYPSLWRGNFHLCKASGGLVSWGPRSFGVRPSIAYAPEVVRHPGAVAPSVATPRAPSLRRCEQSGMSRVLETTRPPSVSITEVSIASGAREYENCCYSETFIQQKLAENQAKLTVYAAQLQTYRNSPAYKAYEEEAKAWEAQRRYEVAMQRRAQALARGVATTTPGDSC